MAGSAVDREHVVARTRWRRSFSCKPQGENQRNTRRQICRKDCVEWCCSRNRSFRRRALALPALAAVANCFPAFFRNIPSSTNRLADRIRPTERSPSSGTDVRPSIGPNASLTVSPRNTRVRRGKADVSGRMCVRVFDTCSSSIRRGWRRTERAMEMDGHGRWIPETNAGTTNRASWRLRTCPSMA